jgi:hypothetical protein
MAERVLLESVKQPGKVVKLGPRLAAHLVKRGVYSYVTRDEAPALELDEAEEVKPRKKRAYKRRDMKAES